MIDLFHSLPTRRQSLRSGVSANQLLGLQKRSNPTVNPSVTCRSGAALVMPRRIPASIQSLRAGIGWQMKPTSAELFARSCSMLSPLTSPAFPMSSRSRVLAGPRSLLAERT